MVFSMMLPPNEFRALGLLNCGESEVLTRIRVLCRGLEALFLL